MGGIFVCRNIRIYHPLSIFVNICLQEYQDISPTPSQVNYMLLHPEVQTKVQEEVDQVLGDRAPSLADRGR